MNDLLVYSISMNINFTFAELNSIMLESESFRKKILDICFVRNLEYYRAQIRDLFPLFLGSQKIPAIKWIREELRGKENDLKMFDNLNYEVYGRYEDWKISATLGLVAAKKFVESC